MIPTTWTLAHGPCDLCLTESPPTGGWLVIPPGGWPPCVQFLAQCPDCGGEISVCLDHLRRILARMEQPPLPRSTLEEQFVGDFCCPRCTGWAFGADPVTGRRWCNSNTEGLPLSEGGKPCGWKEEK